MVQPERRSTGWKLYDAIRRYTRAAESAAGPEVLIVAEVREGRSAQELLGAPGEGYGSVVVVAADPRPSWFDSLRPSFTTQVVHGSGELVIVVPPREHAAERPAGHARTHGREAAGHLAGHARPDRARHADLPGVAGGAHDRSIC